MDQTLFEFVGELSSKGLPPVADIPLDVFGVQHDVHLVPLADPHIHVEGFPMRLCTQSGYIINFILEWLT